MKQSEAISIQVTAVEQPKGDMTLVLGVRENDHRSRTVGFYVVAEQAVDICAVASQIHQFPVMTVPDRQWFYVFSTGERQFLHLTEGK